MNKNKVIIIGANNENMRLVQTAMKELDLNHDDVVILGLEESEEMKKRFIKDVVLVNRPDDSLMIHQCETVIPISEKRISQQGWRNKKRFN